MGLGFEGTCPGSNIAVHSHYIAVDNNCPAVDAADFLVRKSDHYTTRYCVLSFEQSRNKALVKMDFRSVGSAENYSDSVLAIAENC